MNGRRSRASWILISPLWACGGKGAANQDIRAIPTRREVPSVRLGRLKRFCAAGHGTVSDGEETNYTAVVLPFAGLTAIGIQGSSSYLLTRPRTSGVLRVMVSYTGVCTNPSMRRGGGRIPAWNCLSGGVMCP